MGILNKLVLILRKLDPRNKHWKQQQLAHTEKIDDPESKESAQEAIEQVFSEANRYNDYGRKLYLIQNCIYGVDIQPIATTIAKLRFFISLVIEQESNNDQSTNYGIRPLPNLETKFVAANTLIGLKELNESEFQLFLENEDIQQLRQEITELRSKHFGVNTRQTKLGYMKREKECREQLAEALAAKHAKWCEQQQNRIEQMVADMPSERAQQQLRERLQREYTLNEAKLAAGLAEANRIAHWDAYDQNAVADFFEPEWMFGVKDGFDIAIGNPPYIRHERIRHLKPALQVYFNAFFTSMADLSVYFYKRAAELLRDDGILTYICTNKFMRSGYGKNLRRFLTTDMSLQILLDFGSVSVFDAAVNTCIVLVKKCLSVSDHALHAATLRQIPAEVDIRKSFYEQVFPIQSSQLSSEEWTIARPETLALLEKLQSTGITLSACVSGRIYFGLKTGCNDAFIIDEAKREELIAQDPKSDEIIKPLLRGRDIKRYGFQWAELYLLYIPWHFPLHEDPRVTGASEKAESLFKKDYPSIYNHLLQYQDNLSKRNRAETGIRYEWYALQRCANTYYTEFDEPKIVYPDISGSMRACYETTGILGEATTFCIPTTDLSLLAILNSRLFDWYARYKFQTLNDPWAGGGLRLKTIYMKHVPIANRTSEQKAELSSLVDQILDDPENENVSDLEKEIDALVYRLYRLSVDEIALIERTYRDAGMVV